MGNLFSGKENRIMKVNGEEKVLEKEILLSEYLEQEGYQTGRIAVERNGEIIPKRNYKETILHNDDVLEVVSFVGGG
jgi:sulfur carrier protein